MIAELLVGGRVRRAWLGIGAQTRPLDRRLARSLGLPSAQAVEVLSLEPESPAARADLREGDSIVAIGGHAVATVDDVHRALAGAAIGGETTVAVIRGQERIELSVTPVEASWPPVHGMGNERPYGPRMPQTARTPTNARC